MLHQQLLVPRIVGGALGLEALDLREDVLVHRGHQDVGRVVVVEPRARHHVRDHEALEVLLVMDGVLHRQDPAPRLPEQHEVAAVEVERLADLLDLVDEPGEVPQRRVVGLVAAERAELVVVVVLDARAAGTRRRSTRRARRVAPGPPCSSSTLRSGFVPTRFVQTRNCRSACRSAPSATRPTRRRVDPRWRCRSTTRMDRPSAQPSPGRVPGGGPSRSLNRRPRRERACCRSGPQLTRREVLLFLKSP